MQRIAFKMKLKAGFEKEYKKRHQEIWPELAQYLKDAGIDEYAIFLDEETHTLFAFQKMQGKSSQELGTKRIVQKWWNYMSDIMETNPDQSPVTIPLKEVFYLESRPHDAKEHAVNCAGSITGRTKLL